MGFGLNMLMTFAGLGLFYLLLAKAIEILDKTEKRHDR